MGMVDGLAEEPRIDAIEKVTGSALYIADLPTPPRTLHAATVRSPYSHARILNIDSSHALTMPGVVAVIDRDHLDGVDASTAIAEYLEDPEGPTVRHQGMLALDKVRFDGDLVAMVAAEDPFVAVEAARSIEVEYELLPSVTTFDAAMAAGAPLVHEDLESNLAWEDSFEWGNVEEGFLESDHVFEEEWYAGSAFHHPMEPATSCLVSSSGDSVDLWTSTHTPYLVGPKIAKLFGVSPDQVRTRIPYIGGGFGAKQLNPAIAAAVALSRRAQRPVRYIATEEESVRATSRHAVRYRAKIGVTSGGRLVALDVNLELATGAYFTGALVVTHNACISAWGCYRIPHFRVQARTAYTNTVPSGAFRATGKNQTTFGVECTLDSVARQLGISPLDIRQQNSLERGERIADSWRVRGTEYTADTPPMDADYSELLRLAVEGIGWDGSPSPEVALGDRPKVVRGRGLALSLRHGAQGGGHSYALVSLDRRGVVTVHHNAPDLGTGVFTVIARVASSTLGIPQGSVRVRPPDSSNNMPFAGTSAQRTTVQMGNAVRAACEDLKRELTAAAASVFGGDADGWSVDDGHLVRDGQRHSFTDLLGQFRAPELRGVGSYTYRPSKDRAFGGLDHWAPGAAACEVEVDLETGIVRVTKYCAVADAGKAIHRQSSIGQVLGGAVMGISLALHEEVRYGEDHLENGNAFDYRLAGPADVPEHLVAHLVENGDGPGPLGAKGLSQTSLPCVAPAIGNAIRDAIGSHIHTYPFTPERVLRAASVLEDDGQHQKT